MADKFERHSALTE